MGSIIQLTSTSGWRLRRASLIEAGLLNRLCGSLEIMWRGGWAERGDPDGVVLLRNQRCKGVWLLANDRFRYVPIETGIFAYDCPDVESVHARCLEILGPILEEFLTDDERTPDT